MAKQNNIPNEKLINIIGEETVITGDIITKGNIRIDGKLNGNLHAEGKIIIGELGQVEGTILCNNLEVLGKIYGKIEVHELLALKSSALLQADIITKKLSVEPGAIFTGHCQMTENTEHEQKTPKATTQVTTQ